MTFQAWIDSRLVELRAANPAPAPLLVAGRFGWAATVIGIPFDVVAWFLGTPFESIALASGVFSVAAAVVGYVLARKA